MESKYKYGAIHKDYRFNIEGSGITGYLDKRINQKGEFAISVLKKDHNYDPQMQFQIFTDKIPVLTNRASSKWNRTELMIPLSKHNIQDIVFTLLEIYKELKEKDKNKKEECDEKVEDHTRIRNE